MISNAHKFRLEMLILYLSGLLPKDVKYSIKENRLMLSGLGRTASYISRMEVSLNGIFNYVYEINHSDESFLSLDFDDVKLNSGMTTSRMIKFAELTQKIMKDVSKSYRHSRKIGYGDCTSFYASSITLRCDYVRGVVIIEAHPSNKGSDFRMRSVELYRNSYDSILRDPNELEKISQILHKTMIIQKKLENKFTDVKKAFVVDATKEWTECFTQMKS